MVVAVHLVALRFTERLEVAVVEGSDLLGLPGGLVDAATESIEDAVQRVRQDTLGIGGPIVQLATFGAIDRDPSMRVISVTWLTLCPPDTRGHFVPLTTSLTQDHGEMIQTALRRVRGWSRTDRPLRLLPDLFTLTEAQGVYEAVLGAPLDRRNFRAWLRDGLVEESGQQRQGRGRPARLFRRTKASSVQGSSK